VNLKLLARRPGVQAALAWLVSVYLGFTLATMRWRFENRVVVDDVVASPDGAIALFWHGRIALAVGCRPLLERKPRRVMISSSPDGELIARIVGRLGFPAIRGSSTTDNRRDRGSAKALREALAFIDAGGCMVVTPDGPRGPPEQMSSGPLTIARRKATTVFIFGLAARPALTLKSWDRTQIPLPFGRGCAVFDGPLAIARDADGATMQAVQADWQARLNAAQSRAEALVAAA
jgi:lysophospholipid acyltransferase (LPLAT)-like uncharacterized protein